MNFNAEKGERENDEFNLSYSLYLEINNWERWALEWHAWNDQVEATTTQVCCCSVFPLDVTLHEQHLYCMIVGWSGGAE